MTPDDHTKIIIIHDIACMYHVRYAARSPVNKYVYIYIYISAKHPNSSFPQLRFALKRLKRLKRLKPLKRIVQSIKAFEGFEGC